MCWRVKTLFSQIEKKIPNPNVEKKRRECNLTCEMTNSPNTDIRFVWSMGIEAAKGNVSSKHKSCQLVRAKALLPGEWLQVMIVALLKLV